MKTLKSTITFLLILIALISCSKDNDDSAPVIQISTQNPLEAYLAATGYNQQTVPNINNASTYEFGISFTPLVDGKLTALIVKIPDVNPNLRVTIWDKTTGAILRTELVNVSSSGVETSKTISAIDLTANREYAITMNSNDYYRHSKTNNVPATYPVIVGDLKIISYAFRFGSDQIMPIASADSNWLYSGDLSFLFQK